MYDTYVTIIGNVLNHPEWRRTTNTGALVATFKIASTSRRLNRETGVWVDGNSLRVRVTCWRALASNVASSVKVGDPLVVTGRLYTRDWTDEEGRKRLQYELEALAIGHDLARGRSHFERVKATTATSAVEDEEAVRRVGGELTEPVPEHEAPARFDDTPYEEIVNESAEAPVDPVRVSEPAPAFGGFGAVAGPDEDLSPVGAVDGPPGGGDDLGDDREPAPIGAPADGDDPAPARRRSRRVAVPA
jgi:single-strand DNA-binding protein